MEGRVRSGVPWVPEVDPFPRSVDIRARQQLLNGICFILRTRHMDPVGLLVPVSPRMHVSSYAMAGTARGVRKTGSALAR